VLLRLFYAVELRYGVIADLAHLIQDGIPVPLATSAVNCIWQGDANDMILRSLALAHPTPSAWNLCRPECFPVRELATRLGRELDRAPGFEGAESPTALLGNAGRLCRELGEPPTRQDDPPVGRPLGETRRAWLGNPPISRCVRQY
jgi:hypothetical protein